MSEGGTEREGKEGRKEGREEGRGCPPSNRHSGQTDWSNLLVKLTGQTDWSNLLVKRGVTGGPSRASAAGIPSEGGSLTY